MDWLAFPKAPFECKPTHQIAKKKTTLKENDLGMSMSARYQGARLHATSIARVLSQRLLAQPARGLRVLVVGSGHVGSWLSCTLARGGATNVVLKHSARPLESARAAVYAEVGVQARAELQGEDVADLDLLFVTTKTYGHESVARDLAASPVAVGPRIGTVLCHNGYMDYEELWSQALHHTSEIHGRKLHRSPYFKALVPGGYTFDPAVQGYFRVTNEGQPWSLLDSGPAGRAAASAMSALGVPAEAGGLEAEAADLKKFLINNTANLISCIHDTNCEGLFADPKIEERMRAVFDESLTVFAASDRHARALEHLLQAGGYGNDRTALRQAVLDGVASYKQHFPSTCKDFKAGQPLEIASLNGYVAMLAGKLRVPAPCNAEVVRDVHAAIQTSAYYKAP